MTFMESVRCVSVWQHSRTCQTGKKKPFAYNVLDLHSKILFTKCVCENICENKEAVLQGKAVFLKKTL